jgi:hypothetical protein
MIAACESQCKRNVYIAGVTAVGGGELAGINPNYGETAIIVNACDDTANRPWEMYTGCAGDCETAKAAYCSGYSLGH